jgi:hypothetical protein
MGEEYAQHLGRYRSPDIHFPEEGNEEQERLAGQIDQRLWSYMYSPGMQTFVNKVDEAIASRFMITKAYIEKKTQEKVDGLQQKYIADQAAMRKSVSQTKAAVWGLGAGLVAFGGTALAAFVLWPKIMEFFARRTQRRQEEESSEQIKNGNNQGKRKNYFQWKRDLSMDDFTPARW